MVGNGDLGRRKEIDRDISSYITGLRKKERRVVADFLKIFKSKKRSSKAELHPEVSTYGPHPTEKKKSKKEEELEDLEMEREVEEIVKRRPFLEWLSSKLSSKKSYEDEFVEEPEKEEYLKEEVVEEAPLSELEEEYVEEVTKQGWFSRLASKIFVKSMPEEELEDAADEIAEDIQDMKVIAEIATNVMKQLPSEEMKEFKKIEDLHRFKENLKKRELIR